MSSDDRRIAKIAGLINEDPNHTVGGKLIFENKRGVDVTGEVYEITHIKPDTFYISFPNASGSGREYTRTLELGEIPLNSGSTAFDVPIEVTAIYDVHEMEEGAGFHGASISEIKIVKTDVIIYEEEYDKDIYEKERHASDEEMMDICEKIATDKDANYLGYIQSEILDSADYEPHFEDDFPGYEG